MLAVAVMFGAAACTEEGADISGNGNESFSFIAEIEQTRADVVDNNGTLQIVWSGDDKLYVTSDKGNFTFANSANELNRFVSTDAKASELRDATNIVITTQHENGSVVDSDAGKRGLSLRKEYECFPEDAQVSLAVQSAFFHLACEYDVTLSTDAAIFSGVDGSKNLVADVTLKAGSDIWVALTPRVEKVSLTATIAGKMELYVEEITLSAGGIYDLGKIVPEVAPTPDPEPKPEGKVVYLVPNDDWKSADAWFAAYLWESSDSTNVKLTDEDGDGIYSAAIPENMTNIIFCRMNPAYTEFAWNSDAEADHVWTQTADLVVGVAPNNYYYITSWETGEWNSAGYTPEPPVVEEKAWAVAGSFNEWGDTLMTATDVANIFVAQNLELKSGDEFKVKVKGAWDVNFGGGITNLMPNMWMKGYQDGSNIVVAKSGAYDIYLEYAEGVDYGKIYLIEVGGDYTAATEQTSNGTLIPDGTEPEDPSSEFKIYVYKQNNTWATINLYSWDDMETLFTGAWPGTASSTIETINGYDYMVWAMPATANGSNINIILNNGAGTQTADFALGVLNQDYYLLLNGDTLSFVEDKENPGDNSGNNPGEEVAGVASEWALAGDFNSWGDTVMYTTSKSNLFVAKSVSIGAYKEVKIKAVGSWDTNYGGGVNYLNANIWTKVYAGGSNFSIINAGTYDVYFDKANERIYVMTEGTDFAAATEQSANGAAPDLSSASWGLCGTHNGWGSPDIQLVWDGTIGLYVSYDAQLTGEFKVRANNSWGEDYGCGGTITVNDAAGKSMSRGGGNCKVASGTYDVYFDLSSKMIWVRTPGSAAPTK